MDEWLLIAGMTAVTFGVRYPVLAIIGRMELPERVFRALRFVPPAVLTAIVVPEMLIRDGQLALTYTNPYLVAGLVAGAAAWRRKSLLLTILVGMAVFLAWKALVTF